jgi:antitoxin component HigA of HigAB toxin-antitoxin module
MAAVVLGAGTLVEAYEPCRRGQLGLKSADLAKILGDRSRASEVLNKKRKHHR